MPETKIVRGRCHRRGRRLATVSAAVCGVALVIADAASGVSVIERFGIASVSAGGTQVHASAGSSGGSVDAGNGITQVFHVDAPVPFVLHGRVTVRPGGTLGIHTAADAASIVPFLSDRHEHALGARLHAKRIDASGRRWQVRLPARIGQSADRVAFLVRFRTQHAYTSFEVGIRVKR